MKTDSEGRLLGTNVNDLRAGVLILPPEVHILGENAISDLPNLRAIAWNGGIERIESRAINGVALPTLDLPASIQEIQDDAFNGLNFTTTIIIHNNDCRLSLNAFRMCPALKDLRFGDKQYVVRSFTDGVVWEITGRHGYDVNEIYRGRPLFSSDEYRYCARKYNTIAYADTVREAKKLCDELHITPALIEKYKDITLDTLITANDYRQITGSCARGTDKWLAEHIPDWKPSTTRSVRWVLKELQKAPGHNLLAQFVADRYKDRA